MSEQLQHTPNFLADLAGIEFECSIAAAELNKRVIAEFTSTHNYVESEKFVIGDSPELPIHTQVVRTGWTYNHLNESLPVVVQR